MKWLASLLVLISISLVTILRVEFWLTIPTLRWAFEQGISSGLEIPWDKMSLEIKADSLFRKTIWLRGAKTCFEPQGSNLKLCSESSTLSLKLDFKYLTRSIREISELQVKGLSLTGKWVSGPESEKPNVVESVLAALEGITVPLWLEEAKIKDFKITLDSADLEFNGNHFLGQGHLTCKPKSENLHLACAFTITESGTVGGEHQKGKVSAQWTLLEGRAFRPDDVIFNISGDVRSRGRIQLNGKLVKNQEMRWQFNLNSLANGKGFNYAFDGSGEISGERVTLDFNAQIANDAYPKLALESCQFSAPSGDLESLSLNCLGKMSSMSEIRGHLPFRAEINVKKDDSQEVPIDVIARVELLKMQDSLAPKPGWVEAKFKGRWADLGKPENMKIDCAFDWKDVPFQKVRKELRAFEVVVPAPFHTFVGEIDLKLSCQRTPEKDRFDLLAILAADLTSQNQNLSWTTDGTLSWFPKAKASAPRFGVNLTSTIHRGHLQLPRLNIRSLPQIFSDSHLISQNLGSEPSVIDYRLRVQTGQEPIFISSNLAKTLIPLTGQVEFLSHQPILARVNVGNVDIELFRRKAQIEYLHFDLNRLSAAAQVTGRLKIPSLDYTVFVTISGTTDFPQVTLSSEPPLPESEVVSVLLYGSPSRESSLSNMDDLQNTQSVLLSRTVNLLSLYVFASTPIQRIDFNPDKSEITATIKASDRITISLGAAPSPSQGTGTLGVRRRISKSWSVVTELNSGGSKGTSSGSLWLEWSKRYGQ
jgi:hypothetical protein